MNKVISGYFDDAHRGLQDKSRVGYSSHVQLPPLSDSGGFDGGGGGGGLKYSSSTGALDYSHEMLSNGVQAERYQSTLQENAKLLRKIRSVQDQLSITSAKKEAFKAQAQRLEKEFKKTREQSDTLQKDLFEAKQDANQCSKEAQEAMQMMTEMRKAHIQEVRLLQRGLAARGDSGASRNKVNEFADLVDKVGRAVVQRDEAIRDRTKMQAQLAKSVSEQRVLAGEAARLRKKNASMEEDLLEAQRKARFRPPRPHPHSLKGDLEDSDEEFEQELSTFERRLAILEEGPAGLDILASNLSKDKQLLEKRIRQQQETMKMLNQSIEDWKAVNSDKDEQIVELTKRTDKMLQEQGKLNEQIAQKRREIEMQVEEEKAALMARISELQGEVDMAQAQSEGLEKVSSRLTKELVKVHGHYGTLEQGAPAPQAAPAQPAPAGEVLAREAEYLAKTGESLKLEIVRLPGGGPVEIRATGGGFPAMQRVVVDRAVERELDAEDPWPSLISRVGVSMGPPRRVVVSARLDEQELQMPPSGAAIILTAYKYDARRFFFEGVVVKSGTVLGLAVLEDALVPELWAKIDASGDSAALFQLLTAGLSLSARGGLVFSAAAALNAA